MKKIFLSLLLMVLTLVMVTVAKANLMTNGDFSTGTLTGWEAYGDVTATNYADIPAAYKNTWDLSAWDSRFDGNFALFYGTPSYLRASILQVPATTNFSLSLDYAVAWERLDPMPAHDLGYIALDVMGVTNGGLLRSLFYQEIEWNPLFTGFEKDVFTGTFFTQNFILLPDLKEILFDIRVFNPDHTLNQIVGIDNVKLSAAPVPEPSIIVLFGLGLVGLAGFRLKLKRRQRGL